MSKRKSITNQDLSAYEIARLENIKRNEAELKRLGLHVNKLTRRAEGAQNLKEQFHLATQ